MEREKELAARYLHQIANALTNVREHIAGSSEPLPKDKLVQMLGEVNVRYDIAGIPELRDEFRKLSDAVMKLPEDVVFDDERISVDGLAADLVNKLNRKVEELKHIV